MSHVALAPWVQTQLESLLTQRGHAWLLAGPSGLGQFELALALARAWLCENPTPHGACGICGSCHAVDVHTHADLAVLMPELLSLELGWPLDEKTQDELDSKKRKPSKEIKVDAAREVVSFTQFTRSRGTTKVVLVFPAERMNGITANTLLKTLEEPPGAVKFILATEAAHQLLPTIRSRCLGHTMVWPGFDEALAWLQTACKTGQADDKKTTKPPTLSELTTLLTAAGGRPLDALSWIQNGQAADMAQSWRTLPKAMARGDVTAISNFLPSQAVDALQKLCHDVMATRVGGQPRFFDASELPVSLSTKDKAGLYSLANWSKELAATARTVEHPYNPGLMLESLVSRAKIALNSK